MVQIREIFRMKRNWPNKVTKTVEENKNKKKKKSCFRVINQQNESTKADTIVRGWKPIWKIVQEGSGCTLYDRRFVQKTKKFHLTLKLHHNVFFSFLKGLAGLVTACAIGAYKFKRRGEMSTSVFLMQLRVAAQGTVVGCLTLGLAYKMLDEYVLNPKKKWLGKSILEKMI